MIRAAVENLDLLKRIERILKGRKNLMFYDGRKDGLEENIAFKYFYSSLKNALDFINIDIYEKPIDFIYGSISIIMDYDDIYKECSCDYGKIEAEKTNIRGVEKVRLSLLLNRYGFENIEDAIIFFEGYITNKTLIW